MRKQAINLLAAAALVGQGVLTATPASAAYVLKYEQVGQTSSAKEVDRSI